MKFEDIFSQCTIYVRAGQPLSEDMWLKAGHKSLKDYVGALVKESKEGLRKQGLDENQFNHLPVVRFGVEDEDGGLHIAMKCDTFDDIPEEDLVWANGISLGGKPGNLKQYQVITYKKIEDAEPDISVVE